MSRLMATLFAASVFGLNPNPGFAGQDDAAIHQHDADPAGQAQHREAAEDHSSHDAPSSGQAEEHAGHDAPSSQAGEPMDHDDDHTSHQEAAGTRPTPAADHDHAVQPADQGAAMTDHSTMDSGNAALLRDPHAYSGGYALGTGTYALEGEHRHRLADETAFKGLWVDRLEYVAREGEDTTELEGHAWIGDSYNRVLLRTEAEVADGTIEDAEIDLLMYQAIAPFWDLQVGFRHQIVEDEHRHWAIIGLNGLAPHWIEVDASIMISEHGQTFYDLEAEYEMRLTQRLVLQPRIDIHSFAKTDEETRRGSGLSKIKLGARLRYEFSRQLAPYLGVERVSRHGRTVDLLPEGVDRTQVWWVAGLKFWF